MPPPDAAFSQQELAIRNTRAAASFVNPWQSSIRDEAENAVAEQLVDVSRLLAALADGLFSCRPDALTGLDMEDISRRSDNSRANVGTGVKTRHGRTS
jgi:hypothetical protein